MRVAKCAVLLAAVSATTTAFIAPGAASAAPTASSSTVAKAVNRNVIVLLKNQHSEVKNTRSDRAERTSVLHRDQAGVVALARSLGARNIHQFATINAVSLSLSGDDVDALQRNSAVSAVVPDATLTLPATTLKATAGASSSRQTPKYTCPTDPSKPILEPEALKTMHVAYGDSTVGAQSYTTGAGIKVAYLADGIDINNPDFIRDGKSVFTDYQDFSTEGVDAPSSAAEAFGDASSIAAQGNQSYDLSDFVNEAYPLPKGCNIKIRGVAPGADLIGLKVFGNADTAPTSRFIQAIEYAVDVDNVDVINESFGANPYPDTMDDPISLINQAAIDAGVSVVASTGDSGITGTIGSPASSSSVISAGATTIFRSYFQTTYGFSNLPGVKGWANDNIATLSSGGFAQNGRVPDVVAPGDSGWALCTAADIYESCSNFKTEAEASPIELFGGTSEAAPLTAGTAALVISAYETAHPGAGRPSPALVKKIITGTARNLGHPVELQGSGEVNALAAVQAARTVPAEHHSAQPKTATGAALLFSKTQLNLSGGSDAVVHGSVSVTNVSAKTQKINAYARTLGASIKRQTNSVEFDGSKLPTILNAFGGNRAYLKHTITVGAGINRLDAGAAFDTKNMYNVFLVLVNPQGIYESYSDPQGQSTIGNYAHVDAVNPVPGKWSLYILANPLLKTKISYTTDQRAFQGIGTVKAAATTLAPGASTTISAAFPLPNDPSDTSAEIKVRSASGVQGIVPVSLRTVVRPGSSTAKFHGIITGGNGRGDQGAPAQANYYNIDVPAGRGNLAVAITFDGQTSAKAEYLGYLVGPDGQTQSVKTNLILDAKGNGVYGNGLEMNVDRPAAGRWALILETTNPVQGNLARQPFHGFVDTVSQPVFSARSSLPYSTGTVLKKGVAANYKVTIRNTGLVTQDFFLDPRSDDSGNYTLASQVPGDDLSNEDLPESEVNPQWLVPTRSSAVTFSAQATENIQLDAGYSFGDPEVLSAGAHKNASVTVGAGKVAQNLWGASAGVIGPFAKAAPAGHVAYQATVHTRLFDPAVSTSTGDQWYTSLIPAPADSSSTADVTSAAGSARLHASVVNGQRQGAEVVRSLGSKSTAAAAPLDGSGYIALAPGQSATISVRIVPTEDKGRIVVGNLYLDTLSFHLGSDSVVPVADEIRGIAYAYKVG